MTTTKNELVPTGTTEVPTVGTVLLVSGIYSEAWEANAERTEAKGDDPCVCCGRAVKQGRGFFIWPVEGAAGLAPVKNWDAMGQDTHGEWQGGNMGIAVLGSTCAKQVPAEYRSKYEG
jgi:hypothetical protein